MGAINAVSTQQSQGGSVADANAQVKLPQETAVKAKPGTLEWALELNELGKGVDSKQSAEQAAAKQPYEFVEEILALGTNAPADPVGAAVEGFRQTGTVTNKQATDILLNSKALQASGSR